MGGGCGGSGEDHLPGPTIASLACTTQSPLYSLGSWDERTEGTRHAPIFTPTLMEAEVVSTRGEVEGLNFKWHAGHLASRTSSTTTFLCDLSKSLRPSLGLCFPGPLPPYLQNEEDYCPSFSASWKNRQGRRKTGRDDFTGNAYKVKHSNYYHETSRICGLGARGLIERL